MSTPAYLWILSVIMHPPFRESTVAVESARVQGNVEYLFRKTDVSVRTSLACRSGRRAWLCPSWCDLASVCGEPLRGIISVLSDDFESQYPNSLPKKTDEQSALNRILQEAATNVIDVAAMGTHNLEQHEYMERVKHYSLKLQGVAGRYTPAPKQSCLLVDIPAPDRLLAVTPVHESDIHQV
ncbi:Ragulator complex protein lamtor1 [Homalodisca vitripennis]|nr:Ragulator complex protein lamtor1 [Homalodisca vitripennis]